MNFDCTAFVLSDFTFILICTSVLVNCSFLEEAEEDKWRTKRELAKFI